MKHDEREKWEFLEGLMQRTVRGIRLTDKEKSRIAEALEEAFEEGHDFGVLRDEEEEE